MGEERYHHQHPFHLMMHEGRLSRGQLQAWALNRSVAILFNGEPVAEPDRAAMTVDARFNVP